MDAHVLVERNDSGPVDHAGAAGAAQRHHRRHVCRAGRRDRGRGGRSRGPPDHHRRPGRGFHRRQRPRRFPPGHAAADIGRGFARLAAASRAGAQPGADHRRGPWQCGRHRHDHAVPLRLRDRRGRLPLRHAVRRSGLVPEAASSLLCPASPAAAAPRVTCCSASRSAPSEALDMGLASHVVPKGELKKRWPGSSLCSPSRPKRCARPSAASPRGPRNPRADGAGERPFRRAASVGRSEGGDHRLLRCAGQGARCLIKSLAAVRSRRVLVREDVDRRPREEQEVHRLRVVHRQRHHPVDRADPE